ncbi:MAG: CvpA family protein [Ruminococcaceae bacterium]|nr:CvpA family protein [Oscillospiraceae bacterium]
MNITIDLVLAVIIGLTVFKHYRAGFVKSALKLGRLVLTFLITALLGPALSGVIIDMLGGVGGAFSAVLGYIILFAAVFVGLTLLANVLSKLIEKSIFATADKLLGVALGVVSAVLLCSFISAIFYGYVYLSGNMDIYENSFLFKLFHDINIFGFIADKISSM